MSVGSQALERSTLEAKDRESLHQIATALGGKPGSRAKKADIITMILELAGVTDAARPAKDGGGADEQLSLDAAAAVNQKPGPGEAPGRATSPEPGSEAVTGDEAEVEAEAEPAPANGNGRVPAESSGGADTERNGIESRHDEARERGREGREGGAGVRNQQHQGRGDDSEPSGRRRRRRGRDRDRQGQAGGATGMGTQTAATEEFQGEPVEVSGLLDLRDEGYGFLRVRSHLPSKEDVYVSVKQVRQFGLRKGDMLAGAARPASRNEKNPALLRIDEVNGKEPELNKQRSRFEELTALVPSERLRLESPLGGGGDQEEETGVGSDLTARLVDLVTPIGRGQRALIVSPPKAGKTTVLERIATAIEANHPDVTLMALLIDARPEEVTDLSRSMQGEVIASTFDRPADEHTMVADLVIERAKRLVEEGRDVVVLLDGLTRLARAFHLVVPATGRVVADGVDVTALQPCKRLFGAARKVEGGGSLTILATALVGTGSIIDEVVVEELRAAANLELHLDSEIARRRIFPAVDVAVSATLHDDLLVEPEQVPVLWHLRRELVDLAEAEGTRVAVEELLAQLAGTATNDEFLATLAEEGDDDAAGEDEFDEGDEAGEEG